MSKDSVVKYTLRLNMNNKQHLEINHILLKMCIRDRLWS